MIILTDRFVRGSSADFQSPQLAMVEVVSHFGLHNQVSERL
jgi:hypothetical protein